MPVGPAESQRLLTAALVAGSAPVRAGQAGRGGAARARPRARRQACLERRAVRRRSRARSRRCERAARELNRYPDGGAYRLRAALAERHGVAFEEVAVGSGADGVIDCVSQAVARPGRRDRLRLAVVPELRDLRAPSSARSPVRVPLRDAPLRPRRAARRDHPAHEARLRLQPEQPDGDDERARRARRVLRASPRARARPCSTRRTSSTSTTPTTPTASRSTVKAGRRVLVLRTFSKIYGLAGLRVGYGVGPPDVVHRDRQGAPRVRPHHAGAGGGAREPRRHRRSSSAGGGSTRRAARALVRDPRAARASTCAGPAVGELRLRRRSARTREPLFEALLREGVIVRPLAGLRRAERDPRHRRLRPRTTLFWRAPSGASLEARA